MNEMWDEVYFYILINIKTFFKLILSFSMSVISQITNQIA